MPADVLTLARCMVLDAEVFPYPAVPFGIAVRDPAFRGWVARADDGRVTGFLASFVQARSRARAVTSGRLLHIAGLAVAPEERGLGVGRALLRAAKDLLGAEASAIALEVATTNDPAIRLYRSEGFVIERLRKRFYAKSGNDAFEMVLRLPR